jgi:hypothetical protein
MFVKSFITLTPGRDHGAGGKPSGASMYLQALADFINFLSPSLSISHVKLGCFSQTFLT